MEIIGLIVLVCIAGLLGGYTANLQKTVFSAGNKLGLEEKDVITPPCLKTRTTVFYLLISFSVQNHLHPLLHVVHV